MVLPGNKCTVYSSETKSVICLSLSFIAHLSCVLFHDASNVTDFMVKVSVVLHFSDVLLGSVVPRENVSKLSFLFVCIITEPDAGYPTMASHWKNSRYRVTLPATNVFGVALNIGVVGVPGIKQSTGSII